MEKKYITPQIKVRKVDFESALLDNSINGAKPAVGLDFDSDIPTPQYGGNSDGTQTVGSKGNLWNNWDDEEN